MAWRRLIGSEGGYASVGFVVIAPAFLLLFFLVIEVAGAFFWWKTAEKATQLGARVAIVRDPVATGVPAINPRRNSATAVYGLACGHSSDPCDFDAEDTWVCEGGGAGCNGAAFELVVAEMRRVFGGGFQNENVRITYRYVELGFVGGPFVPTVTVTLSGVPFGLFLGILSGLGGDGARALATLPDISTTLTAEDLTTAGAG
jgi:hypothetical protein